MMFDAENATIYELNLPSKVRSIIRIQYKLKGMSGLYSFDFEYILPRKGLFRIKNKLPSSVHFLNVELANCPFF